MKTNNHQSSIIDHQQTRSTKKIEEKVRQVHGVDWRELPEFFRIGSLWKKQRVQIESVDRKTQKTIKTFRTFFSNCTSQILTHPDLSPEIVAQILINKLLPDAIDSPLSPSPWTAFRQLPSIRKIEEYRQSNDCMVQQTVAMK